MDSTRVAALRGSRRVVAAFCFLAGCSATPDSAERVGRGAGPIVNGHTDTTHASVGLLTESGQPFCTGTRVGNRTVLTAAHCIQDVRDLRAISIVCDGTPTAVSNVTVHPSFTEQDLLTNDLAILTLAAEPRCAITSLSSAAPQVGQLVTLVGYGATSAYGSMDGTRREASTHVLRLDAKHVFFPAATDPSIGQDCYGDSGGPAFVEVNGASLQIGVTSGAVGPGRTCIVEGYDARVDVQLAWLRQASGGDIRVDGGGGNPPPPPPGDVAIDAPAAGAVFQSGEMAEIRIDASRVQSLASVKLVWESAGQARDIECRNGQDVACAASGGVYRWSLRMGAPGSRTFHAVATDGAGQALASEARTIRVN